MTNSLHKPSIEVEPLSPLNSFSYSEVRPVLSYLYRTQRVSEGERRYLDLNLGIFWPCPVACFALEPKREPMKNTKFLVKVNRGGARAAEYVLRIDRSPIQTTTNKKLALAMGRFTAEDAVKSMQNSRCTPELISVFV